jgi:hypothetical protein
MALSLKYGDLIPDGTRDEFEQLVSQSNGQWDAQHDDDGSHTGVTCDSLTTRDAAQNRLPVTGNLVFLRGGLYLDTEGSELHVAGLRPAQWAGDQSNYNPPGLRDAFLVEVETDADRNLTGIAVAGRQKRLLLFGNRGNFTVTLKHNSSSSLAVHRIAIAGGADMALGSGEYVWLFYDVGSTLWRIVGPL